MANAARDLIDGFRGLEREGDDGDNRGYTAKYLHDENYGEHRGL